MPSLVASQSARRFGTHIGQPPPLGASAYNSRSPSHALRMTANLIEGPSVAVRRALLSVSDKTGLLDLARALAARGVELLSTGGTAKALREAGLEVRDVSDATGFPEMMDGRVKTLHPVVHGGLLGRAGIDDAVMAEHGIGRIDLLVLNLYPFVKVSMDPASTFEDVIENIDIGGPAMLRSAAKNFARVAVATDPAQYAGIVEELNANEGALSAKTSFSSVWKSPDGARFSFGGQKVAAVVIDQDESLRVAGEEVETEARRRRGGAIQGGMEPLRACEGFPEVVAGDPAAHGGIRHVGQEPRQRGIRRGCQAPAVPLPGSRVEHIDRRGAGLQPFDDRLVSRAW